MYKVFRVFVNNIHRIVFLVSLLFLSIVYFKDIGLNPYGFFCDEAEYGLKSLELIQGQLSSFENPFYYWHYKHYLLGSLAVYALVPTTLLLSMSEVSVRLSSSIYGILSLIVIYFTLRRLGVVRAYIPILLYGLAPLPFLISRIYFSQMPSIFFIVTAYYLYVLAKKSSKKAYGFLSGIVFGLGLYGHLSFLITIPVIVGLIIVTELLFNRSKWKEYLIVGLLMSGFCLASLPVLYTANSNEAFFNRLKEKQSNTELGLFESITANYGKYYNLGFLFSTGESRLPGAFVQRHSYPETGMLLLSSLLLILVGVFSFFVWQDPEKKFFSPWLLLLIFYPVADIITTHTESPPYTFTLIGTMICVPYIMAFGTKFVEYIIQRNHTNRLSGNGARVFLYGLLVLAVVEFGIFYITTAQDYPTLSAGYWGWQSGPKEIVAYYSSLGTSYDDYYLEGMFNQPQTLLDFYLQDNPIQNRVHVGFLDQANSAKQQLFAITKDSYTRVISSNDYTLDIKNVINYPSGEVAFYIVEVK
jgi:4-amino-4-deoxy-L-arabinose transferase-like glycosyltransferase